jgi:hypothetical protein
LTILQFLSTQAVTGEDVCRVLGFDLKAFRLITHELWKNELIQGEVADGCCCAPCGSMCVSAMKINRIWRLSTKGQLLLKMASLENKAFDAVQSTTTAF